MAGSAEVCGALGSLLLLSGRPSEHARAMTFPLRLNRRTQNAFRAPGVVEGTACFEQAVDELALALELDPLELREIGSVREHAHLRVRGQTRLLAANLSQVGQPRLHVVEGDASEQPDGTLEHDRGPARPPTQGTRSGAWTHLPRARQRLQPRAGRPAALASFPGLLEARMIQAVQRCDSAGGACASISGATAKTYDVVGADVGQTLRVRVTARNADGAASADSSPTAVVTSPTAAPKNTERPTISGTTRVGQTLTATVSSRTGKVNIFESGETSYSYEIETSGDQSICVDNLGRATNYTLTVSIR